MRICVDCGIAAHEAVAAVLRSDLDPGSTQAVARAEEVVSEYLFEDDEALQLTEMALQAASDTGTRATSDSNRLPGVAAAGRQCCWPPA